MSYNVNGQLGSLSWVPLTMAVRSWGFSTTIQRHKTTGRLPRWWITLSGETISYQYDALKRSDIGFVDAQQRQLSGGIQPSIPI